MDNKQGDCETTNDNILQSDVSVPSTIEKCSVRGRKSIGSRSLCFDALDNRCQDEAKNSHLEVQLKGNKIESWKKYLENLKSENDSWKVMCVERKRYYKELDKHKREAIILDRISVENILTKEDKLFVSKRHNYEDIIKELNKFGKLAAITTHQKQKTAQLKASVQNIIEQQAVEKEKRLLRYLTSLYM